MKNIFIIFSLFLTSFIYSQTDVGLIAYYSFDNDSCFAIDVTGNVNNNGIFLGSGFYPECEYCGVNNKAVFLNGIDDKFVFGSSIILEQLTTKDFTLSFYFKAVPTVNPTSTLDILSRREDCSNSNAFAVEYYPGSNYLNVIFKESNSSIGDVSGYLSNQTCWHHIVIVREGPTTILYENGKQLDVKHAIERIDILNNEPLFLGKNSCTQTNSPFEGYFDEFRIYSRALNEEEVEGLYLAPDRILNGPMFESIKDTTIFLGNSVYIDVNRSCQNITTFTWSPTDDVIAPDIMEPVISPQQTTTYYLQMNDNVCTATDSLKIIVIDPSNLDCGTVYLPKAFTPNDDNLNDEFGISNPIAVEELLGFEIFDRWGSKVFSTTNPYEKWDGTFKGHRLNPGVFLYKVNFKCKGEEKITAGSITLIR